MLPGCCYAVAKILYVFLFGVSVQLLGYSGWFPVCCYVAARISWVIVRELHSDC